MEKKGYQKPTMAEVVLLQHKFICYSEIRSVSSGDADISYRGGSNESARARRNRDEEWDDE